MSTMKIVTPEDTITQMARRAYGEFRKRELRVAPMLRIAEWDTAPIIVHATWKEIIRASLGRHGTMVNCNPGIRDPHTLIITGLGWDQAQAMRAGIEAKLGGTVSSPAMTYSDKAFAENETDEERQALGDDEP